MFHNRKILLFLVLLVCACKSGAAQEAPGCREMVDFVFVLDHSGSIDSTEFATMKTWTKEFVKKYDIGFQDILVGYVAFASDASFKFHLDYYTNIQSLLDQLDRVTQIGGGTNIGKGISKAADIDGQRADAVKVMIVLSDGVTSQRDFALTTATQVASSWTIYSVGVGSGVDKSLMETIAEKYYFVDSVDQLIEEVDPVLKRSCEKYCSAPILDGASGDVANKCLYTRAPKEDDPHSSTECSFTCLEGYESNSTSISFIECALVNDEAEWAYTSHCVEIVKCGSHEIDFSDASRDCSGTRSGDICYNFDCLDGYHWDDEDKADGGLLCQEDAQGIATWVPEVGDSTLPKCLPNQFCEPLAIPFGGVTCANTPAGSNCYFKCQEGFRNNQSDILGCDLEISDNGIEITKWDITPVCIQVETTGNDDEVSVDKKMNSNFLGEMRHKVKELLFGSSLDERQLEDVYLNEAVDLYSWEEQDLGEITTTDINDATANCADDPLFSTFGANCAENAVFCDMDADIEKNCPVTCGTCPDVNKMFPVPRAKITKLDLQYPSLRKFYDNYGQIIEEVMIVKDLSAGEQALIGVLTERYNKTVQDIVSMENLVCGAFCSACNGRDASCDAYLEENPDPLITALEGQKAIIARQIALINARLDKVDKLRNKLNEGIVIMEDTGEQVHDWHAIPSPDKVKEQMASLSNDTGVSIQYTMHTESVERTSAVENEKSALAAYVGGEFRTISFSEEYMDMSVNITVKKLLSVLISPGAWYDDSWSVVIQEEGRLEEGYSLECDEGSSDICIWGKDGTKKGILQSIQKKFYVAEKVEIEVTGQHSVFREISKLYRDASVTGGGIRFGDFCTGKACATTVNVILDTMNPFTNCSDMTYIENLLRTVKDASFYELATPNYLAVLGPQPESVTGCWDGDIGSFMWDSWKAVLESENIPFKNGDSMTFHDGADQMETFFMDLENAMSNGTSATDIPQIIWFASTSLNEFDDDEFVVLENYAHVLDEFAKRGGGLIVHGTSFNAFQWLTNIIEGGRINEGECNMELGVHFFDAGRDFLPDVIDENVIKSIKCQGNFDVNVTTNLDRLVGDGDLNPYVLGAYGGISAGSSPFDLTGNVAEISYDSFVGSEGNKLTITIDPIADGESYPTILGIYAPTFP